MLAQTLKALEDDGLVDRKVLAVMPPNVEYRLTEPGAAVAAKVVELIDALYLSMGGAGPRTQAGRAVPSAN